MTDERAFTIQGLRDLAQFLEDHPTVPAPLAWLNSYVNTREAIVAAAKEASWIKDYNGSWFSLRREFPGNVRLDVYIEREHICRKEVTGTELVPARPAEIVETFRWICDEPLLAAENRS